MKFDHSNTRHRRSLVLVALAIVFGSAGVGLTQSQLVRDSVTGVDLEAGLCAEGGGTKIVICHVPTGHPENAHTITIAESALSSHLAHGDTVGACQSGPTCQDLCQSAYEGCIAGCGGDPDCVAVCNDQLAACTASCP